MDTDTKEIKSILNNNKFNPHGELRANGLMNKVITTTSFIDEHYDNISLSQRYWHIKHDTYYIIKCYECNNNLARYNRKKADYITCSEKCRHKKSRSIARKTFTEVYGVDNPAKSDIVKEKSRKTSIKIYGVDNYAKTNEYREVFVSLMNSRYGVDNYSKTEEFKSKIKETSIKIYGVDNPAKSDIVKEKCANIYTKNFEKNLTKDYILIRYDKRSTIKHTVCNNEFVVLRKTLHTRSKNNHELCTVCNPLNKNVSVGEKELLKFVASIYDGIILSNYRKLSWLINPMTNCNLELDIFIPELDLALEYNGKYSHADSISYKDDDIIYSKTAKEVRERDILKTELCENNGIKLLQIREEDWKNENKVTKKYIYSFLL